MRIPMNPSYPPLTTLETIMSIIGLLIGWIATQSKTEKCEPEEWGPLRNYKLG